MTAPQPPLFSPGEIANQEQRIRELVDTLCTGEALAFVGAGFSHSAGYPLWNGLIEKLVAVVRSFEPTFSLDPKLSAPLKAQEILEWMTRERGPDYFRGQLSLIFRPNPSLKELHRDFASLPFRAFITTNYDFTIEEAIGEERKRNGSPFAKPGPLAVWRESGSKVHRMVRGLVRRGPVEQVLHLHGHLDFPIGYILASSHYTDAYGLDPNDLTSAADRQLPLPAILAALMMTRRLVFVGFGHADQYIADVLERVADTTWDWEQTIHFAILPVDPTAPDADRRLAEKLMSRMGIATIFYQTTNGDHTERDRLVHKIAEDVESRCGSSSKKALSGAPIVARNLPRWATAANTRALMTERVE